MRHGRLQRERGAFEREARITLRNELTISDRDCALIDAVAHEELTLDEFSAVPEHVPAPNRLPRRLPCHR